VSRTLAASLAIVTVALAAPSAHAGGPDRKECIAAADDGQRLRDEGKLGAARDKFLTCAAKGCPAVVAKQCGQWLEETDGEIPSISFRVLDREGKEILDARVIVDGRTISESVDARALSTDPGEHTVRVERDGAFVEEKVLLRPGEKNRIVELAFKPAAPVAPAAPAVVAPPPAKPEPTKLHVPLLGWIGVGVAVAGGVTTAAFAIMANDDESQLRSTCAPACPESERSAIDTKVLVANIGLGVGIAGLGFAIVTTVLANTGPKAAPRTARTGLAFDFSPTGIRGAF
jgi:hypothetical protein